MVKFALKISCAVENLTELSTCGPDFQWNFKVLCGYCNESDNTWHGVSQTDEVMGRTDIVKDSVKILKADESGAIKKQVLAVLDCRGMEPIDFDPQSGWMAKNDESGSQFTDVDLTEDNAWVGYDEREQCPVGIDEFKSVFERM